MTQMSLTHMDSTILCSTGVIISAGPVLWLQNKPKQPLLHRAHLSTVLTVDVSLCQHQFCLAALVSCPDKGHCSRSQTLQTWVLLCSAAALSNKLLFLSQTLPRGLQSLNLGLTAVSLTTALSDLRVIWAVHSSLNVFHSWSFLCQMRTV